VLAVIAALLVAACRPFRSIHSRQRQTGVMSSHSGFRRAIDHIFCHADSNVLVAAGSQLASSAVFKVACSGLAVTVFIAYLPWFLSTQKKPPRQSRRCARSVERRSQSHSFFHEKSGGAAPPIGGHG
jgi:hypothetical protein